MTDSEKLKQQDETRARIFDEARKSFDLCRSASSGVARTGLLWAAALAIIFITGLEPTLYTVTQTSTTLAEINSVRQDAIYRVLEKNRELISDLETLKNLEKFERCFPDEESRKQQQTKREEACKKYLLEDIEYNRKELEKLSTKDRKNNIDENKKALKEQAKNLNGIYADAIKKAESQDRNIGFNILGIEFKSPPLLAPLLWHIFCIGLLGYLSYTRENSIVAGAHGIQLLMQLQKNHSDVMADISGRLPTWTIHSLLPKFTNLEAKETYNDLDHESWISRIFGTRHEQILANICLVVVPLVLWVSATRAAWISLEFSHHLGPTWARALLPLVLVIIIVLMASISIWWVFGSNTFTWLKHISKGTLNGLIILALGIIVIGVIILFFPSRGIYFGLFLQNLLIWIAILFPLLLITIYVFYFHKNQIYRRSREIHTPSKSIISRRRLILIMSGLSGLSIVFLLQSPLEPKVGIKVGISRKTSKTRSLFPKLPSGFYSRISAKSDSSLKDLRTDSGESVGQKNSLGPSVLHYIGIDGLSSKRGQLPPAEKLRKTTPPRQIYSQNQCQFSEKLSKDQSSSLAPEPTDDTLPPTNSESTCCETDISPRVHLAAASWSFEEAALSILRSNSRIGDTKSREVCELLLCGIQHDIIYKCKTSNNRKKAKPSFRLYDLLAGVAVRYRQDDSFRQLLKIIDSSQYKLLFEPRIEKWKDVNGPWRQHWRNKKKPVVWKSSKLGAVVF